MYKALPYYHWCDGCAYGTRLYDRYMCPFVEGSCVRIAGSLDMPDAEKLHNRINCKIIYDSACAEDKSERNEDA